jgi:hypothetical protein
MREKLITVAESSINDVDMLTNLYPNNQFIGISESTTKPRTAYVNLVSYKGKNIFGDRDFKYDITKYHKQTDGYTITIGYGELPQLSINPSPYTTSTEVIEIVGKRKNIFGFMVNCKLEITIVNTKYLYELVCGTYKYSISEDIVIRLYNTIKNRRSARIYSKELEVLNKRFDKYKI